MSEIVVHGPDGKTYNFPAGTDEATMREAMQAAYPKKSSPITDFLTTGLIPGRKMAGELAKIPYGPTSSPVGRGIVKGIGGVVEDLSSPAALATGAGAAALGTAGFPGFALGAFFAGDALKRGYDEFMAARGANNPESATEHGIGALLNTGSAALPFLAGRRMPAGASKTPGPAPTIAQAPAPFLEAPGAIPSAGVPSPPTATSAAGPASPVTRLAGSSPTGLPAAAPRVSSLSPTPPALPMATQEVAPPPTPSIRSVNIPTRGDWANQPRRALPARTPPPWSRTAAEVMANQPREPVQMGAPISGKPVTNPPLPGDVVTGRRLPARGQAEAPLTGEPVTSPVIERDPLDVASHSAFRERMTELHAAAEPPEDGLVSAIRRVGRVMPPEGSRGEWERIPASVRRTISAGSDRPGVRFDELPGLLEGEGVFMDEGSILNALMDRNRAFRQKPRDLTAEFSELGDLGASPGKIAAAIRKDGDNPLYLKIQERVRSVARQNAAAEREAIQSEAGDESFDFNDESGFARFKNPGQSGLFDVKQTSEGGTLSPRPAQRVNPMQALADEFLSGQLKRRETVLREAIGRVMQGSGTWTEKRLQVGLPEAEVPISTPEIDRLVKAKLAEGQ